MANREHLSKIIDRILNESQTEEDIAQLRRSLKIVDGVLQSVSQNGKFNTNIGQIIGGDIHIGDRIYQGADAEAIKEALSWVLQEQKKAERPRNEKLLLQKIKNEVISRLKQSLQNAVLINLGKEAQPQQVKHPLISEIKIGHKPTEPIANDKNILDIFDQEEIVGKLLILGNPGAGKTTTMLDLAKALIVRAEQDADYPIPVLFNLSTWKDDKQSMRDWLVVELKFKYGVRKDIAANWIDNAKLLPMLDGLDELESVRQEPCVQKINELLQSDFRPQYLIVCSRWEEYGNYNTQLQLHGAISLRNLDDEQILDYLRLVKREDLWEVLHQDEMLLELVRTPFWLSILVLSEQELQVGDWLTVESTEQRLELLLNAYVQRMLGRELSRAYGKQKIPSASHTKHWLAFLAAKLIASQQIEFSSESIRPDWLPKKLHLQIFNVVFLFISTLLLSGVGLIFGSLFFDFQKGIFIGTFSGILFSWYMMSQTASNSIWKRISHSGELIQKSSLSERILEEIGLIPNRKFSIEQPIFPVSKFQWSWKQTVRDFVFSIPRSFLLWLVISNIFNISVKVGIYLALFNSVATSFIAGSGVFKKVEIERIVRFDQSIRVSLKSACLFSIFICLSSRLIFWILASNSSFDITPLLIIAILQSVSVWNDCGGGFLIQHFALRLLLSLNGYMPWDYTRFLDYCTERLFLQRVGGRYRFIHRLLQEHFASMPWEKSLQLEGTEKL